MYGLVNLLLFSSWYILLFRNRHSLSFVDRLLGTFILALTQIVFTEMLLGVVFRQLFAVPLFLLNITISVVVLVLAIYPPLAPFYKAIPHEFKDETLRFFNIIKKDRVLLIIFTLFFLLLCWIVFQGYLFPSYTWDALWYHLPAVGQIIQSGAIQENPTPFFIYSYINAIPKNIELFFLWNTIFLKSNIIIDLSQLPFTLAGILAIYSIGIKIGLKKEHAIYSSILFFFTPVVILQSTTNYVDIAVAVLFFIAINFLLYHGLQNHLAILLGGLSSGLLLGSKGSAFLFAAFLSAMAIIRLLKRHQIKKGITSFLIFFIAPVLLIGGYWNIKNWVVYGNPLYPVEISFSNHTLFKGLIGGIIEPMPGVLERLSPISRLIYTWMERVEYYFYDSRLSGFGPIWFILLLPSILIAIIYAIKKKGFDFLLISAISVIIFSIYPRNWNARYVIFILGFGCLSFGMTLDYFEKRQGIIKFIALLLIIYTFFTANSPCITPSQVKRFLNLPANERTIARHAPFNIDLYAHQEYGLWIWISNNILEGDVLAYTFEPLFAGPLWNSSFSNKVVFVKSESYKQWIEELKNNQTTYILIRSNSPEDKWIEEEKQIVHKFPGWLSIPERFKVVYSDENYKVLRLIDERT